MPQSFASDQGNYFTTSPTAKLWGLTGIQKEISSLLLEWWNKPLRTQLWHQLGANTWRGWNEVYKIRDLYLSCFFTAENQGCRNHWSWWKWNLSPLYLITHLHSSCFFCLQHGLQLQVVVLKGRIYHKEEHGNDAKELKSRLLSGSIYL
jgi:hypothetical protein